MHTEHEGQEANIHLKEEAGHFFRYMADFVKFTAEDARAIRESTLVVEKHIPAIVSEFYINLLKYPQTRKFFLKKDGSLDAEYLQLRMYHQANFWRRTAGAEFNDDYANFVNYVGRAHTSRGADAHIYIHEQYVIGMVGFVMNAINAALISELDDYNKDLETRAVLAWNKLCIILLEMLTRAYREESPTERPEELVTIDHQEIRDMSVDSYEKSVGIHREYTYQNVFVAFESEIPEGERRIIESSGISIGVFHHHGEWYAIRNSCLHRGGPVATGKIAGDHIVCPWHGYTYDLTSGRLLLDPSARLDMYAVVRENGKIFVSIPEQQLFQDHLVQQDMVSPAETQPLREPVRLKENEFYPADIPPGSQRLVRLNSQRIVVYNLDGVFYATSDECTHAGGPLSEGTLNGDEIICPWHDSCFNIISGAATCPPAEDPVRTYRVVLDGDTGRVEE